MKKDMNLPYNCSSLSELHRMLGLPMPTHPLISLVNNTGNQLDPSNLPSVRTSAFYKIALKQNLHGKLRYGQQHYDFDQGGMLFVSPNQVAANGESNGDHSGYTLIIHPDFLQTYPLAKSIKKYGFFSYSANEALHLSAKEKETLISIFRNIEDELQSRLDDFS
jgi:AraC family transcriptional activator of pobA